MTNTSPNWRADFFRFLRRPTIIPVIGVALGPLVGWIVFSISSLKGMPLFLVGGSITGLIIGLVMGLYVRRAETLTLSEITLNIPEFAQMKFAINAEYRRVAWKLFVETLTRIATQPLGSEDGSLREALTSLYSLFSVTRDLLKNMQPSKATSFVTVEMFAVRMLNQEIRPFLSKWHTQLKKFESIHPDKRESEWEENKNCRKELEALRNRLISYTRAFGELAGVKDLDPFFGTTPQLTNR